MESRREWRRLLQAPTMTGPVPRWEEGSFSGEVLCRPGRKSTKFPSSIASAGRIHHEIQSSLSVKALKRGLPSPYWPLLSMQRTQLNTLPIERYRGTPEIKRARTRSKIMGHRCSCWHLVADAQGRVQLPPWRVVACALAVPAVCMFASFAVS